MPMLMRVTQRISFAGHSFSLLCRLQMGHLRMSKQLSRVGHTSLGVIS